LVLILAGCYGSLSAQEIGPTDWQTEQDFRDSEVTIIQDIQWLEDNPVATELNDTKAISEYVLAWLANTPYITVTKEQIFLEGIVDYKKFKYGEKFRVTYLFGKALYQIQHQEVQDEVEVYFSGIDGMVRVYTELKKLDPGMKNKLLAKYVRLEKSGKLQGYIIDRLAETTKPVQ
jgi:hypothetical protein